MNADDPLILVLYNVEEEQVLHKSPLELIALQDTARVAMQIHNALTSFGYRTVPIAVRNSLSELRQNLAPFSPKTAFVFNNCDGFGGNNMAATKVIRLIETLGFKHTGSTARVIKTCIDKSLMKEKLALLRLPTPRYQVFTHARGNCHLRYPVIVKPLTDDASIGIDFCSVVQNHADLMKRIKFVIEHYKQAVLVEEFIQGRELAVSLWGNHPAQVLPITEYDYSVIQEPMHRILTYDIKWDPTSCYYDLPIHCPAHLTPSETQRIMKVALSVYRTMGLRDYGRIDMRYRDGIPYVIDVNEVPDLGIGSGFPNAAAVAGFTYPEAIKHILELALERENWLCPKPVMKLLPPYHQTASVSSD